MVTAYGPLPTQQALLAAPKQQADRDDVTTDAIDWAYFAELLGPIADLPSNIPVHIDGPTEPDPCGGTACLDGNECDAEYVVTHRATHGLFVYRTPVCRGCLPIEINHLRTAHGTDPATVEVRLPAPLVNQ